MPAESSLLIERLVEQLRPAKAIRSKEMEESPPQKRQAGLPWRMAFRKSDNYIVPPALDRAAYVALLLGQPLLLTGEPGAGKSDFARKVAHVFGLGDVQEVHVKTTTLGRDLVYSFDEVARFRDASGGANGKARPPPMAKYVRFNALGRAILRSAGPDTLVKPEGRELADIYQGEVEPDDKGRVPLVALFPAEFGRAKGQAADDAIAEPIRTVVLVDEIDKAQRDTPNDLLDEIERMRFSIPELDITIAASAAHWPIVIITSNAERVLPAPFLRRCVFHRLTTPEDPEVLLEILAARMTEGFSQGALARDALAIFLALRRASQRQPGLSELLAWCLLLERLGFNSRHALPRDGDEMELLEASLSALSKTEADFEAARHVLAQWRSGTLAGAARPTA